jgi:hypothetical protein
MADDGVSLPRTESFMPSPLALCLEDLDSPSEDARFVRCVAKAGRGDGLALDARGCAVFGQSGACELVVSLDERLMLVRHDEAVAIVVRRAGRSLLAPLGQRVILRDQDEVQVGERRLRVHVHGPAPEVHAPHAVSPRAVRAAASVAAMVAIGAGAAGCKDIASIFDPIDVRVAPPEPMPLPPDAMGPAADAATPAPGAASSGIEVRIRPPEAMPEEPKK